MINRPIGFRDSWETKADWALVALVMALVVAVLGWTLTAVKLIDARHVIAQDAARCEALVESMAKAPMIWESLARECGR